MNFENDVLQAMAEVDGVVAIKEASFDARRFVDTARLLEQLPKRITLLTGNDNFILESFLLGATGALIGFGAVMTREQVDMIRAWQEGRSDDAMALGRRVQRLADVVFAAPVGDYRVRLKECLRILGVLEAAHVRRPLLPISDAGACAPHGRPQGGRPAARAGQRRPGRLMAAEPADVLIIGAGASGGVVAKRLAEAGFGVVCLEQGDWLDRADYPGNKLDWELKARKDWATSPNIRGLAQDYPIVEDDTPVSPLMYNAVGGSTIIFAGAWPRALPSDFRVRSLDGVADDWPIDYFELLPYFYRTDRDFGVSGLPGDPAYPPDTEDAPMPPLPIGSAGLKVARGMTKLGWHWWPEFNSINSVTYDGRRPCVQRSTCQSGCNEGAKASTDLTHWPKAIARGARLVTGARVRRIETDKQGLATGATWIDRDGAEHFEAARVVVVAANAIGTPRLLLLSDSPAHPDGLANSSGLVGKRLMMHPFANVAGLFEEPLMSWQGQFGDLIESLEFYETDEKRGFVRGARWGLAPTGGPINTALPSRAGEQIWGAGHHAHVRTHLGHGANWGLFAEDLPDEANHITLSSTVIDSSGIPAPEVHYSMADNARRMLDFHIERATESMEAAGAYKIEVDRLMRYSGWHLLGTARMGDDPKTSVLDRWNRAHDVPNLYVVDGSCFVTSSGVNPTSTIVAIALRAAEHMVETRFEQQVPA